MSATAESIDVRITGDASGATGAMTRVGEAVSGAVTAMQQKLIDLGIASKESFGVVGESSLKAAAHVEESSSIIGHATEKMKMHMESVATKYEAVTGLMGKLNGVMIGALALLAGGEAFDKAIEKTNELAAENLKLSKTFGMTLAEASGFHAALAKFGIDTETVTGAVQKMDRQLKSHESALVDMGVKTRDTNGELRNQLDIFMSGLDALRDYKEGTDRNLAAQAMFGRGVGDVAALLKLNRMELEEGAESARKLGLVTDQEGVESMKRYKVAINETKEVFEAIMVAIGKKVLPVLTELAEYIKNNGQSVMEKFRAILDETGKVMGVLGSAIKALWDVAAAAFGALGAVVEAVFGKVIASEFAKLDNWLLILKGSIQIFRGVAVLAFEVIGAAVDDFAARVGMAGEVIGDFLTFKWDKLAGDWDRGMKKIDAVVEANARKIKGTLADMMKPVTLGSDAPASDPAMVQSLLNGSYQNGLGGAGKKNFKGAPGKDKADKAGKADTTEQDQLDALQKELAKEVKANSATMDKLIEDRLAAANKAIRVEEIKLKGIEAAQLDEVAKDRAAADNKVALGAMTAQQRLDIERTFLAREYAIKADAIACEIALEKSGPNDPLRLQTMYNQQDAIRRQHDAQMLANERKIQAERTSIVRGAEAQVVNLFSQSLAKMATMQASFASTIKNLWGGIVNIAATAIEKMVQQFIAGLFTQEAASKTFHAGEILRKAKQIYTSTVASVSSMGAPPPIPQIAGAAAFAGALAFSAERGYAVPAGVMAGGIDGRGGTMGIVHPGEMILDEPAANNLRDGKGGGGDTHIHLHGIVDGDSVTKLLHRNNGAVASALKMAVRNGVR